LSPHQQILYAGWLQGHGESWRKQRYRNYRRMKVRVTTRRFVVVEELGEFSEGKRY
jgi:hypothetical protein